MYRAVLVLLCLKAGWPDALELDLDDLAAKRENITVRKLTLGHVEPMWKASDDVSLTIERFLQRSAS